MEELDFDPDSIAKFQFPETPPWTYRSTSDLTLSHTRKDQTDPSTYVGLHNEVNDVDRDSEFIYTDGSVLNERAAAASITDNYFSTERLLDSFTKFSAEVHALCLAHDRVEKEYHHFL